MYSTPISVFLVKNGQGGDRVLFRYPYKVSSSHRNINKSASADFLESSPASADQFAAADPDQPAVDPNRYVKYKLSDDSSDVEDEEAKLSLLSSANLRAENVPEYSSKVLSNLFAVHPKLCDKKFELKINDVRFVGHPLNLELKPGEEKNFANIVTSQMTMFQVVFALQAMADYSIVELYHDLSQQIGVAVKYEERRVGYLSEQANILNMIQEEASSLQIRGGDASYYALAAESSKSQLANALRNIFEDVSHTGHAFERINNYIEISFCLPQKVFHRVSNFLHVEPESVWKCLEALRPYHGILLLYEERELLDMLPLDASPTLKKMLVHASPTKSFRTIASDSDLALKHVFHLAGHLLYWGLAIVIYPICESNIYVVSPKVKTLFSPVVVERFNEKFPGENIVSSLAMFSLPTSISQRTAPIMNPGHLQLLTRIIVWMLQQHLIVQIHSYITLILNDDAACNWDDPVMMMEKERARLMEEGLDDDDDYYYYEAPQRVSDDPTNDNYETILEAFNEEDRNMIMSVSMDRAELAKFAKVAIFMNGKYHLEEIMYHMDLRRAQLLQIIDRFSLILVRHEHEDPALTKYYKH